jgi:hypothetical protein
MPNLPGKGLFGPGPAVGVWATMSGTTPLPAVKVWCGDANGVPVLVWAATAGASTGVSASYSASPSTRVTVSWTNPSPVVADSYEIRRPDGSLAGTALRTDTTFYDNDPRPLSGSYIVRAILGASHADAASNSLNLSTAPQSLAGSWTGAANYGWSLTWSAPSWGAPDSYNVYANGALVANVLTPGYVHRYVTPNSNINYTVAPVLSGVVGTATGNLNKTRGTAVVSNLAITENGQNFADDNWYDVTWSHPAYGAPDSYTLVVYDAGASSTVIASVTLAGSTTSWRPPAGTNRARVGYATVPVLTANYTSVGSYEASPLPELYNPASYPVTMTATTNPGALRVQWADPAGGWTHFEVEVLSNPTTWVQQGLFTKGSIYRYVDIYGLISSSGTYARVRAHSYGGSSQWVLAGPFNPGVFGVYAGAPV